MSVHHTRMFLIGSSLLLMVILGLTFITGPAFGWLSLTTNEGFDLLYICAPVFTGYLSAAGVFAFSGTARQDQRRLGSLQVAMAFGPIIVFFTLLVIVLTSYQGSHVRPVIDADGGWTFSTLKQGVTFALAILSTGTAFAVGSLFPSNQENGR